MTSAPPPDNPSRQQPSAPPESSSFFRWLRGLGITRAPDRWIGGVAGGVAHRTGLDLALVRGLIVVLAIFGGIGVLLYGLAWALLPEPDGRIHAEQAARGTWTSGMTGAGAFVVLGLVRPNLPILGDANGAVWTLFWIGVVGFFVYWVINRSNGGKPRPGAPGAGPGTPGGGYPDGGGGTRPGNDGAPDGNRPGASPGRPAEDGTTPGTSRSATGSASDAGQTTEGSARPTDVLRPHPLPYRPSPELAAYGEYTRYPQVPVRTDLADNPSRPAVARRAHPSGAVTALLIGAAATTAGTLLVLGHTGLLVLPNATVVALAAATVVLALGVIGLGLRGRSSGLVGLAAAITLASALISSFAVVGGTWVVAQDGSNAPSSLRTAAEGYSVLGSQSTVDLAGLPRPERDLVVPVSSLVSDVTVIVPDDVPVEVRLRSVLGNADASGEATGTNTFGTDRQASGGILQRGTSTLNAGATGATLIVDVRNALGQLIVVTASSEDQARNGGAR